MTGAGSDGEQDDTPLLISSTPSFLAHWPSLLDFQPSQLALHLLPLALIAGLWTEEIFHIPYIAQWSDKGRIFDPEAMTNLIPVVLHVAVILNLNTLYQNIAHWLTGQ